VLCLTVGIDTLAGRPVRHAFAGTGLVELVTIAIWTPFFWWSMHFLLAGRVPWRRLLPAALATGVLFTGLGAFSEFYFSSEIVSDSKTYGTIGAVFGIVTGFIAIGAVIVLGAVAGSVWSGRKAERDVRKARFADLAVRRAVVGTTYGQACVKGVPGVS
jgi:uncharacterized BrkB/YihY/UPF0761 family membrane protein